MLPPAANEYAVLPVGVARMMPSPCTSVTLSPSTLTSSFASEPPLPRCTSTSFRHWKVSVSWTQPSEGSGEGGPPGELAWPPASRSSRDWDALRLRGVSVATRRRSLTTSRMRQTTASGALLLCRSRVCVSVRTQPSSEKGVRKPRDPAAKESAGGMPARRKSETAQVRVPSPPMVMIRSTRRSRRSAGEKVRMPGIMLLSWGWSLSSCCSRIGTMPCEASQATMSCTVAKTIGSRGLAMISTVRGRFCQCIRRCEELGVMVSPACTTFGPTRSAEPFEPDLSEQARGCARPSWFAQAASNALASSALSSNELICLVRPRPGSSAMPCSRRVTSSGTDDSSSCTMRR
mmetsp:Transcript_30933/g.78867  ORF Transcript_30933/g.78867 Transcript_30933/m.78867 type:complete len:347 (-) Transcript_30933:527-1567(-)